MKSSWTNKRKELAPLLISGDHKAKISGIQFVWTGPKSLHPSVIDQLAEISKADVELNDIAIIGSPGDGILIRDGARCQMTDCLVAGNWGRGVMLGARGQPPRQVRIAECEIRNNYKSHIAMFYDVREVRIERNLLHGTAFFAIRPTTKGGLISGNAIFHNARSGLYSTGSSNDVTGNLFYHNGFGGISCWSNNQDLIVGNTFVGNAGAGSYGVICVGDAKPEIRENIFVGYDKAIMSSFSGDPASVGQPEIGLNLYWNNQAHAVRHQAEQGTEKNAVERKVDLPNELVAEYDPSFQNVAQMQFSLKQGARSRREKFGAGDVLVPAPRFPLHPIEAAIIPDGEHWDFQLWKKPPKPDSKDVERRLMELFAMKQGGSRPKVEYAQAFNELYETLGRTYPNFDVKGIDWIAVGTELLPRAKEVKDDREFGLLCHELVARLEDSHASLGKGSIDPPTVEFPRWDPGFACLLDDRDKPVVYHVDRGGPADRAGFKVGMTIVSINGKPAEDAIDETIRGMSRYLGFSSDRYARYQAARWFTRTLKRGAMVRLETNDINGNIASYQLPATADVRYLPRRPVPLVGIRDSANVDWTMLRGNIGLIYVRRIRNDLLTQLDQAVAELKDAKAIIIDVRGNSGGGFDAQRAHINFSEDKSIDPARPRFTGPMAVLIDSRCISAGEGWASWFVAKQRARFFGTATAGASARKTTYELTNKLFTVTYPVKPYKGFLDRIIERRGIEPDDVVKPNAEDLANGRDTVLNAAVNWLKTQD